MEHDLFWFIVCSFNRYSVYYSVGSTISSSVSWLVGLGKINLQMATIEYCNTIWRTLICLFMSILKLETAIAILHLITNKM